MTSSVGVNLPGPARIEQFNITLGNHTSVQCKACGQSPSWKLKTGRSELIEMLDAIALHQCDTEIQLRYQMGQMVRELRQSGQYDLAKLLDAKLDAIYPSDYVGDDE